MTQYINRSAWAFLRQIWPLLQRSKAEELRIYWRRFFPVTTRILRRICYSTYSKNTLDHGRKILTTIWLSPMYKIQIHVNTFVAELDHRGHKCNLNWIKKTKKKQTMKMILLIVHTCTISMYPMNHLYVWQFLWPKLLLCLPPPWHKENNGFTKLKSSLGTCWSVCWLKYWILHGSMSSLLLLHC